MIGNIEKSFHRYVSVTRFYAPEESAVDSYGHGRGGLTLACSLSERADRRAQQFAAPVRLVGIMAGHA